MTALIVVLAIVAFLALLAILPFGADFEYSENGIRLNAVCGLLKIKLIPGKNKPNKEKKPKKSKKKKEKKKSKKREKPESEEKKGGALDKVKAVLPTAVQTFRRFFRHLSIDVLIVRFTIYGDDPCDTAMNFGYASASVAAVMPILTSTFKIKKVDIHIEPAFIETADTIYIRAKTTLRLWEIIYIIIKLDFKAILSIL